ncbi:MAG: proline--tRNA ligase, partial [Clostridia bacterium]|nr:proline--tRNA ligase [Clostridia bacterium]MBP5174145.1 proline--tRNA ligase [Clostridia bacterium]
AARELADRLSAKFRVKLDDSDNSTGWKYAQYEMKGVPIRIEIGPRDIENGTCVIVSRVSREKQFVPIEGIVDSVEKALDTVFGELYRRAKDNLEARTTSVTGWDELLSVASEKSGFIKAMWCGDSECEDRIKNETGGVKSRCIPFDEEQLADVCVCCGRPAKHMVVWGRQY